MSADFASTKPTKARKPHKCEECGRPIEPGETYHRTAGSWEGDFFTNNACAHCAVFRKHINKVDYEYFECYYGGVSAWVGERMWLEFSLSFEDALRLYRMARHFRGRWRDGLGDLRPIPSEPEAQP